MTEEQEKLVRDTLDVFEDFLLMKDFDIWWMEGQINDFLQGVHEGDIHIEKRQSEASSQLQLCGWIKREDALPLKSGDIEFRSTKGVTGKTRYRMIGCLFDYDREWSNINLIGGSGNPDKVIYWRPKASHTIDKR